MLFGKIRCFFVGIHTLFRYGQWLPHVYMQSVVPEIIIASDRGFRVSTSFAHNAGERVYPNACLITGQCIYCGKREYSWHRDFEKYINGDGVMVIGTVDSDGNIEMLNDSDEQNN